MFGPESRKLQCRDLHLAVSTVSALARQVPLFVMLQILTDQRQSTIPVLIWWPEGLSIITALI